MKQLLGEVTVAERDAILQLHERRNGLNELLLCLKDDDAVDIALKERIRRDRDSNDIRYKNWWCETSNRYGWATPPDARWELDFASRQVVLLEDSKSIMP